MAIAAERVTVGLLPSGPSRPGTIRSLQGRFLRVELDSGADLDSFKLIKLVEVNGPRFLYFGEVQGVQGNDLMIWAENFVDRASIAMLEQHWHTAA